MTGPALTSGTQFSVAFPTSVEALLEGGAERLTALFHASGALPLDDRVTRIAAHREFFGGGMGRKLWLTLDYAGGAGLHRELFVKFTLDFGHALRDWFSPLMASEVSFAVLSMREDFTIAVPRCYFGDYDPGTLSGLLITERVPYGENGIERCYDKCLDFEIPELLDHYRALTRSMARLAAAHKGGALGAAVDDRFPFDPAHIDVGARIGFGPEELEAKLARLKAFAAAVPQLFPDDLRDPAFLDRFAHEARLVFAHKDRLYAFMNGASDYVALCHWNVHVDNAWFWRDADGALQAGLLDWGSVGQMNLGQSLFGMTCAAEVDFLNAHRDELLRLFVAEFAAGGGGQLDEAALMLMYRIAIGLLSIAWLIDAPTIIEANLPDVATVSGRHDPRLRDCFLARAQHHIMIAMLNEWRHARMDDAVTQAVAQAAAVPAGQSLIAAAKS